MHSCNDHDEISKVAISVGHDEAAVGHADLALLERDSSEHESELWGKEEIGTAGVHADDRQEIRVVVEMDGPRKLWAGIDIGGLGAGKGRGDFGKADHVLGEGGGGGLGVGGGGEEGPMGERLEGRGGAAFPGMIGKRGGKRAGRDGRGGKRRRRGTREAEGAGLRVVEVL